jgi:hypothetical protein
MQLRWIAMGLVCFSAALLSACGGAPSTALASKADASAMSKADGRYDTSKKGDKDDKDDCDESEDHDKSSDKSRSLTTKAKDDDAKECKDSDEDHDKSKGKSYSRSLSMSRSSSKDNDKDHDDDDATCKVTVCHVPPGNACKEHTIRVGKSAAPAHIAHGDYTGSCDVPPPPPPPPPAPTCTPAKCPVPVDPNAAAICNPDGSCGSTCIPPAVFNGTVCNLPS